MTSMQCTSSMHVYWQFSTRRYIPSLCVVWCSGWPMICLIHPSCCLGWILTLVAWPGIWTKWHRTAHGIARPVELPPVSAMLSYDLWQVELLPHYWCANWPQSVVQRSASCLMSLCVVWFVWLHAGAMLVERFVDNRLLLMWSHLSISQAATRRYRRQVEDIKTAHRDLANLFLETWLTGRPLYHFDLHEWTGGDHDVTHMVLDVGRRYVGAQPLLLSKSSYNLRRLSELWYQLLNAG